MMAVPTWTKEWRPLARALCVRVRPPPRSSATTSPFDATGGAAGDTLPMPDDDNEATRIDDALAMDRIIGQLYSHRFLECHRKQVLEEIDGVAAKLQIHSLGERGERLQQLAAVCIDDHYQVLKMLLALARSPTMATDEQVALDRDEALYDAQQRELEERDQAKQMHDQLLEELFEISTNDEWYQEWDDDDDDENAEGEFDSGGDSGEDSDSVEATGIGSEKKRLVFSDRHVDGAERPRGGEGDESDADERMASLEELTSSGSSVKTSAVDARKGVRFLSTGRDRECEEILLRDALLLRYYPRVLDAKTSRSRTVGADGGDDGGALTEREPMVVDSESDVKQEVLSVLSMETPGLLYTALDHHVLRKAGNGVQQRGSSPLHRLVHEKALVTAVFQALAGVESFAFDVYPVSDSGTLFHSDFASSTIALSKASREVALAHVSPAALYRFLARFAHAATDLQSLRDLVVFVSEDSFETRRCCTLEGLAQALSTILRGFDGVIWSVEQQLSTGVSRQATLMGVYGGLKPLFGKISWLKGILVACFRAFSGQRRHEVRAAERATSVLNALYYELETEYVQGVHAGYCQKEGNDAAFEWSRYDILLHLFASALTPYLDLLQSTLFERGHSETLALHDELFFVTPLSVKRAAASSPLPERNQDFKDALLALAPFEVDPSLVPVFLAPAIPLFNQAVASRQMQNRYLQQHVEDGHTQHHQSRRDAQGSGKTLSELFHADIVEPSAFGGSNQVVRAPDGNAHTGKLQANTLQYMPFNRIMKQCLMLHVEQKVSTQKSDGVGSFYCVSLLLTMH